jgi:hypothetical protein
MKIHTKQLILAGKILFTEYGESFLSGTADRIKEALVIQSLRIAGAFLLPCSQRLAADVRGFSVLERITTGRQKSMVQPGAWHRGRVNSCTS